MLSDYLLKRREIKNGTTPPPQKPPSAPIAPKSDKLKEKEKEYKKLAKEVLKDIPMCQVATDGCTGAATELHHRKGRGVNLLVRKHLLPVCRNCHTRIENDPQWALDNGYSISRHKIEKE